MTGGSRQLPGLMAVFAVVLVPLLVAGFVADQLSKPTVAESDGSPSGRHGEVSPEQVASLVPGIAGQVEEIRNLRFESLPEPRFISLDALTKKYRRAFSKESVRSQLEVAEAGWKMLGIIGPNVDLSDLGGGLAGQIGGYYDRHDNRLYVIRRPANESLASIKLVLAHELDHALEDQRFGLPKESEDPADQGFAEDALVEGSAENVQHDYGRRFLTYREAVGYLRDLKAEEGTPAPAKLPPVLLADLAFPYDRGEEFVGSLRELSSDWDLVDIAFRSRPPLSSEQVMHPFKYLRYEKPLTVRIGAGDELGRSWRHLIGTDMGEFDTYLLLRPGVGKTEARRAAAGWGGDRLQFWRRGSGPCGAPCPSRDALISSWRWDTVRDRRQFDRALRRYIVDHLGARRTGGRSWSLNGGSIAISDKPAQTTIAFAPTRRLALSLAASGA